MAIHALDELEAQYRVLREGAGIIDRAGRGHIDALGPDVVDFLQGQVTNDVAALEPGHGCYAALLDPKGKILADLRALLLSGEEVWLDTEEVAHAVLLSALDRYKIGRRVELADRTPDRTVISLIGPAARGVAGVEVHLTEHSFERSEVDGIPVLMVATDLGIDVVAPREGAKRVVEALTDRGGAVVSADAAEIVRIESGRPRYGVDMADDNLPGEAGLEQRAVNFTKGCYVGQEPVARMHYRGHPNRYLRGLFLSDPAPAGETLFLGDKEVGTLTSSCVSPALGPIGLSIVRREVDPTDKLEVGRSGASAKVIELPFPQRR
jgi:tRNA-modifying protein YgfZ